MSNAIQQIAERMLCQWEDAVSKKEVKVVRIIIKNGDETMLSAFYDYLLAIDITTDEFVFLFQLPFIDTDSFSRDIVTYLEKEIKVWNEAQKPQGFSAERIEWTPDYTLADGDNPASLAIRNLSNFADHLLGNEKFKCNFILHLDNDFPQKDFCEWLEKALQVKSWSNKMTLTFGDSFHDGDISELSERFPEKISVITPDIDMDGAMERLAEQALLENQGDDVTEDEYRLNLVKLINSVKKRQADETQRLAKRCFDLALTKVRKDLNWIGQFVTLYLILLNDQLGYGNETEALYFADKAIDAAGKGIGKLDDTLSYRLLANALLSKAAIYIGMRDWRNACPLYQEGSVSYHQCADYFMQMESLRMCGYCQEKLSLQREAADSYHQAYLLNSQLSLDVLRKSTFPLIALSLYQSPCREEFISDIEFEKRMKEIFGTEWQDFLFMYQQQMKTPPQIPSDYGTIE